MQLMSVIARFLHPVSSTRVLKIKGIAAQGKGALCFMSPKRRRPSTKRYSPCVRPFDNCFLLSYPFKRFFVRTGEDIVMFKPSLESLEDRTMPSSGIVNPIPPVNPGQIIAQVNVDVSELITRTVSITNQALNLYRNETETISRQLTASFSALGQQDFLSIFVERTKEVTKTVSVDRTR